MANMVIFNFLFKSRFFIDQLNADIENIYDNLIYYSALNIRIVEAMEEIGTQVVISGGSLL